MENRTTIIASGGLLLNIIGIFSSHNVIILEDHLQNIVG